ncbi:NADPH:quinone reductase [Dehalogenimonas formicexedens]|uniref:NADPH:quinone reductase n=1 Tax=Dehalogenimonas formicexedens TaxID=1839801 RepID=A0A1P8F549_9CHLR|nr:NAD(P)-dependent alcohol dehydrogenase [Dehalogenimonas formicexedens]APV43616.1 NADPH:quinone reductase [Dehalogenimonas formicexedens]
MKAIISTKYGPPEGLEFTDVAKPLPKDDEVLIKVHAASINAYDWHLLTADFFLVRLMGGGFFRPKNPRPGEDVAGTIESVGKNVQQFKPGDEVFGDLCECGSGGFAEYVCAKEGALVLKPANINFEQAAATPMAAVTALHGLRDSGCIQAGQKVLINGASGGVGTFAVQIAKSFGAEVTAVCSTRNVEQARKLGADHVIDYTKEDFTRSGQTYDLIFAANGNGPVSAYKRALTPEGIFVVVGGSLSQIMRAMILGKFMSRKTGKKITALTSRPKQRDLAFIKGLLENRNVFPVIDRRYPLNKIGEALRYLGEGHARGKIVITMGAA